MVNKVMKKRFLMSTVMALAILTGCGKNSLSATDIRQQYIDRQKLAVTVDNAKQSIKDGAVQAGETVKNKAEPVGDAAREAALDAKERAEQAAGEAKDTAQDAAQSAGENIREGAEDIADAAKDAARKQAEDTRQDKDHLFGELKSEWDNFLTVLQSPTGIGSGSGTGYTDEDINGDGGSSDIKKTDTFSDGTDGKGAVGRAPTSVIKPPTGIEDIPSYSGSTVITVNNNSPYFTDEELTTEPFELYSPLDGLGRCDTAYANICADLMPKTPRGDIGMVKPTGWKQKKYEGVIDEDPPYLYNRCHLIAYSLAGENANTRNLITGTRHFNIETGMEAYELEVLSYVKRTGNHVLYRVTPMFEGEDLVARGVLMEARSVEDNGLSFCVFVYNVQPGVAIDYRTGESWLDN